MAAIDHDRFVRVLIRCAELAAEPGMKKSIVRVHGDILKDASERFRSLHWEVQQAETAYGEQRVAAYRVLGALDAPYRETRSVVLAYVPAASLPDTLKVQPTDTDKQNAITSLLKVLESHAGKPWADEQKLEAFSEQAPAALVVLGKAIAANTALADAKHARALAFDPAYERYLRFKRVVRDALGQHSKHYKRIHLRRSSRADDQGTKVATPADATAAAPETATTMVAAPAPAPAANLGEKGVSAAPAAAPLS